MDTFTSSPPTDLIIMAEQIWAHKSNFQELMKQNVEFKKHGCLENQGHPKNSNASPMWHNRDDGEYHNPSNSKATSKRTRQTTPDKDQMMEAMRKELDEVKSTMTAAINLDGMLNRTNSPFTTKVLECPLPLKFKLPQLEVYESRKDPLDHISAFKTILDL